MKKVYVAPDIPEGVVSVVAAGGKGEARKLVQQRLRQCGHHHISTRHLRLIQVGVTQPRYKRHPPSRFSKPVAVHGE